VLASTQLPDCSTQVWLTRVVNAISCPCQTERLRCTHRTMAACSYRLTSTSLLSMLTYAKPANLPIH
jgi:hypothetical protein